MTITSKLYKLDYSSRNSGILGPRIITNEGYRFHYVDITSMCYAEGILERNIYVVALLPTCFEFREWMDKHKLYLTGGSVYSLFYRTFKKEYVIITENHKHPKQIIQRRLRQIHKERIAKAI